jgi:hypothetical protein
MIRFVPAMIAVFALALPFAARSDDSDMQSSDMQNSKDQVQNAKDQAQNAKDQMKNAKDQAAGMANQMPAACASDAQNFCSGKDWGTGLGACLRAHKDQVSADCNNAMAAMHQKMHNAASGFHKACGDDVEKFCSNVEAGKGHIIDCLKGHTSDLSSTCKSELNVS